METIDYFNLFVKQTEFTEITDGDFENICKNNRMSFSKLPSQEEIIEIQKQVIQKYAQKNVYFELSLKNKQTKWSPLEKTLLDWVILKYSAYHNKGANKLDDCDWVEISKCIGGRNAHQCKSKWNSRMIISIYKHPWTEEEDCALVQIQNELGLIGMKNKWERVAEKLKDLKISSAPRPAKQCRERWVNKIDPSIERSNWMEKDDLELAHLLITHGKKWADIRRNMDLKRTEFSIRQRYQIIYRKYQKMSEKERSLLDETTISRFSKQTNSVWTSSEKEVLYYIVQKLENAHCSLNKKKTYISISSEKMMTPLQAPALSKKFELGIVNTQTKTIRVVDVESLQKMLLGCFLMKLNQNENPLQKLVAESQRRC